MGYLGKKDAYIPAMGVLTKHTKDIVNKWKAALGSKKVSAQKCIKIALDALDLVEIVHKKCMNLPEHIGKIQRNEIMQGQLLRAWSDVSDLFPSTGFVENGDLSKISKKILENDKGERGTNFYKLYKESNFYKEKKSYDMYMANPSVPDALKKELEAIETD